MALLEHVCPALSLFPEFSRFFPRKKKKKNIAIKAIRITGPLEPVGVTALSYMASLMPSRQIDCQELFL